MRTSPEIDKISEALAIAQGEFKTVAKNKINPHFKNSYADLASIIEATRFPLHQHGIFVTQSSTMVDGRLVVSTRLIHKSGQWIESDVSLKIVKDDPQGMGSALTYARRYGRSAALDLSADDDDDGEMAQKDGERKSHFAPKPPMQQSKEPFDRMQRLLESFSKVDWDKKMLEQHFGKPLKLFNEENFLAAQKLWKEINSKETTA